MSKVKCSVQECQFNKDVMCYAPMIQVNHNGPGKSLSSDDTQCDTFRPKK